ncbi:MAG: LPXTG cell wall anchor domain-containing protein, partial [Clostridia bacterium]|nr:LPXTG cell wall anchor domain-containing protein [Clostridia bacterium]
ELPSSLDLRNYNGKNYVTPDKLQTPFGTCWAFGAAAASESSYLFTNNLGVTAGEENNNVNFSEKYINWYTYHTLTKEEVTKGRVRSSQVGEGLDVSEAEKDNQNMVYYFGGSSHQAANLFASGFNPVDESVNVNGEYPYYYSGKERTRANIGYSEGDDWTLPRTAEYMNVPSNAVFRENRLLPSPALKTKEIKYEFNQAGVDAIKSEIAQGRSVSVGIAMISEAILRKTNWSHYCYSPSASNHEVTIVGYDDNYPKENFSYTNSSGKVVAKSVPPENGAFIVKNSLGSLTEEDKATATTDEYGRVSYANPNANSGGVDDTGYFYLSYYDQSIDSPVSFSFDKVDSVKYTTQNYDQYNMMFSSLYADKDYSSEVKTANVFDAEEDEYLYQISYYTNKPDTTVNYEIYKNVEDGNPSSGVLLEKGVQSHQYGGWHKIDLSGEYFLEKGEKYSVVLTMSRKSGDEENYTSVFPFMFNLYNTKMHGVINEGESYFYNDGKWNDAVNRKESMIDYAYEYCMNVKEYEPLMAMNFDGKDGFAVDNYPIKAISVPASEHSETHDDHSHIWNDGTIKVAPTCTTDGVKEFTCTVCGATKTETVSALGHNWSEWSVIKEATKTEEGQKSRKCANCGETETKSVPVNATETPTTPTTNNTTPTQNNSTNNNTAVNTQTANEVSSSNAPKTGDENYLIVLLTLVLAGMGIVTFRKKYQK